MRVCVCVLACMNLADLYADVWKTCKRSDEVAQQRCMYVHLQHAMTQRDLC